MFNAVMTSILILLTIAYAVVAPVEARKVRDGRIGRTIVLGPSRSNLTLSHEQFLARYRRQLARTGCIYVAIGGVMSATVIMYSLASTSTARPWTLASGPVFLLTGLVSVWCRRYCAPSRGQPRRRLEAPAAPPKSE